MEYSGEPHVEINIMSTGADAKMQDVISAGEFVGRLLLGQLFIIEALSKLGDYGAAADYMANYGMPTLLLPPAIAAELGGGLLVLIGWRTRIAALALAGFCLAAAAIFHSDFSMGGQLIHFQKNLALAGGFLILAARGAGRFSLDARRRRQVAIR